jgi:5-methylcytosine-specific restriction endonuclease McrA
MKVCKGCGENKELSAFSPSKSCSQGTLNYCKVCVAKKRKEQYWADPEKHRAASRKFSQSNLEKMSEINKKYREANPEKVKKWKADDRQRNKHRISADNAKRRAQLKTELTPEIVQMYALRDFYIAMSLGESFHVDHIIPLAKGGKHSADNLQVIPAIDNLRKGKK